MSKAFRLLAAALGYEAVKWRRSESMARQLQQYFANHQIDYLIDVGANRGQFGKDARRSGYAGRIVSCEPSDAAYRDLEAAAKRDRDWRTKHVAVGDVDGEVSIHHYDGDTFTSTLRLNDYATSAFPGLKPRGSTRVKQVRLDSLIRDEAVPEGARVFLKTDTQGGDLQVLQGLGDRFPQLRALMIEMSVQGLYCDQPSHWQVLSLMQKRGLELYGFAAVARDKQGALIEYDALFVRA